MRRDLIIGILVSLLFNGSVAWFGDYTPAPKKAPPKEEVTTIKIVPPPVEPDEEVAEDEQKVDQQTEVAPPMQQDIPSLVNPNTIVQRIEPPAPPGLTMNKGVIKIPTQRGWGRGIKVFNINDLDQQPVATYRVNPNYPYDMHSQGITGQVVVDFIIDTEGKVHNAYAFSSSRREFEAPAVQAVTRWKFRPGRKGGRAVNTHVQQLITFTLSNDN